MSQMSGKFAKRRGIWLGAALTVVFVLLIALPAYAGHDGSSHPNEGLAAASGEGGSLIAGTLNLIVIGIIKLAGPILNSMISGLIAVSGYNDFINSLAVVNGWVVVRDVANMFFIIVFLIIAFGTIVGKEEYHYKKLLPKLLILAVLVNFSRTITGVMIDFAQVIMLTFVNGYQAAAGGNFANIFRITELLASDRANCPAATDGTTGTGPWEIFGALLLALIMVITSLVTVGIVLAVLVVRIIMLWVLIVLSPLAFLAGTFPQGQKYYTQWWEEFKNQVMVGPMLAFFLWLSLVSIGGGNAGKHLIGERATDAPTFACSPVATTEGLISYILGIMMLLVGVQMAQSMGGAISGVAGQAKGIMTKALKFGGKVLAAPAVFGAGLGLQRAERALLDFSTKEGAGVLRRGAKYLTPTAWKGVMQRGKGLLEESRNIAQAQAEEEAHVIFTLGKRRIPLRETAEHAVTAKYAKDLAYLQKEVFMAKAQELEKLGGAEGERARAAIITSAAHGGYLDDIARLPHFRSKLVKLGRQKYGYQDGTFYNKQLLNDLLWDYMAGAGVGTGKGVEMARANPEKYQYAARMITALEAPGKSTKHWEYLGHGEYNAEANRYEAPSRETLMGYSREEYNKLGDRDRAGAAPHVWFALRETGTGVNDVDGRGTLTDAEKSMMSAVVGALTKEARGMQGRSSEWMLGSKIHDTPDIVGSARIVGTQAMADYFEQINQTNSDFAFGLYARRTASEFSDVAQQGKYFEIVDDQGNLIQRVDYRGARRARGGRPPTPSGGPAGGAPRGGPGGGAQAGGGGAQPSGGPAGGGGVTAAPQAPGQTAGGGITPAQVLQASPQVRVHVGQMQAIITGIAQPGFGGMYDTMRKLVADLRSSMAALEKSQKVQFGELSKKLTNLDKALPGEGASAQDVQSALSKAGLNEDDVRTGIEDILRELT